MRLRYLFPNTCVFTTNLILASVLLSSLQVLVAQSIDLKLRYQERVSEEVERYHTRFRPETWDPSRSAVIVCDMWDAHHCVNAVRRVAQLAPRIDAFCKELRQRGVTIIHAPSSCVDFYADHPARRRAASVEPASKMPEDIASWCDQIPNEEMSDYPVDQSAGGEDDDPEDHRLWADQLRFQGCDPRAPWVRQVDAINIDEQRDFISDSGTEIWSILASKNIDNVILVGVHTNMCVLGRPFGLRRMAASGKNVVLARDLTDTMYDPKAWPFASHFTGTDLVVSHVEKYVCPTISGEQILGGSEFRFVQDRRPHLLVVIAEDEYKTVDSLPSFAAKHLSQHFRVSYAFGSNSERHEIVGLSRIEEADAVLISVRRRAVPENDMRLLRNFVAAGKPVIGIRTASHAFSLNGSEPPNGKAVWETFDADVFGGSYSGHYANDLQTTLRLPEDTDPAHAIVSATSPLDIVPGGSLYKTSPLKPGSRALLLGSVAGEATHPTAWTYVRSDGGRSFYTSLGHEKDFQQAEFEALLAAGIHWACEIEPHTLDEVVAQNRRYVSGQGRQR